MVKINNLVYILDKCTKKNFACSGLIGEEGIPGEFANIIHYLYIAIQVVVPVLLIIFGMIEFGKAMTSQKEDEIKSAQGSFFKKLILGVLVFLLLSIVRMVVDFANSGNNSESMWNCVDQLINANCSGHSDDENDENDASQNNQNQTGNNQFVEIYTICKGYLETLTVYTIDETVTRVIIAAAYPEKYNDEHLKMYETSGALVDIEGDRVVIRLTSDVSISRYFSTNKSTFFDMIVFDGFKCS